MAFALKLTGIKWRDGEYSTIQVPGEMSARRPSSDDARFREISISAGYLDYYAIHSVDEALKIAASHYQGLSKLWEPTGQSHIADETLSQVEEAIEGADFVLAHLFEWESGLG